MNEFLDVVCKGLEVVGVCVVAAGAWIWFLAKTAPTEAEAAFTPSELDDLRRWDAEYLHFVRAQAQRRLRGQS